MQDKIEIPGYRWESAELTSAYDYLLPALLTELDLAEIEFRGSKRIFELGCGNSSIGNILAQKGWDVSGVDPSSDGISQANATYPHLDLVEGYTCDDLASHYGKFPIASSLEVVVHVYALRHYVATLYSLIQTGGTAIISTLYQSYWKNCASALTGKMDVHFTALWDHGHIKFFSTTTLSNLLQEAGFKDIRFRRVGRIPPLAKSMIAIVRKP